MTMNMLMELVINVLAWWAQLVGTAVNNLFDYHYW